MKIHTGCLVSLDVRMFDAQGNLLEVSEAPLVYLHGANDIFAGIERALEGKVDGDEVSVFLQPHEAFGDDDPDLLHLLERNLLGSDIALGMRFEGLPGQPSDGRIYTVTDLTETVALLDGNHPLAGRALRFDLKVRGVEALNVDELAEAERPAPPDFLRPVSPHEVHRGDGKKH
ncbi:MAG TPA: peptidylprolyl isomerase [Burkholderiaceae bacterium]|nr:peptidylprolyl isomerase [Burkholderiaceae bacterium]